MYFKIAAHQGKPLAPVDYDYDSLDNRDPEAIERCVRLLAEPMQRYFDGEVQGLQHAPHGPALFVGNHSGGTWSPEIFLLGAALYRERGFEGLPYGLAHDSLIRIPPAARLFVPLGAVRANHDNAARLFDAGKSTIVFPGGDEDAFRASRRRDEVVFGARRGYIRLALRHGVPIVPFVTAGAHDVFIVLDEGRWLADKLGLHGLVRTRLCPIVLSVPWGLTVGMVPPFFPLPCKMRTRVLEPIRFEHSGSQAADDADYVEQCHARVHSVMQAAMDELCVGLRGSEPVRTVSLHAEPDNDGDAVYRPTG